MVEHGAFHADQFRLEDNVLAHQGQTGPEIWEQSASRVTAFVDFAGTGGSFTGVMRALKERNPAVRGYLVEPASAPAPAGEPVTNQSHVIQGGGYSMDELPLLDRALVAGYLKVTDSAAMEAARLLAHQEGIFGGFSGGANLAGAVQVLQAGERGAVAFLICDSGLKYLSTDLYP